MADIFVSYAREDKPRVEKLVKSFKNEGWTVWWDKTIPPGKTFDEMIEEAINAAKCLVVLWSEISTKSDWVKEEANIGKERKILVPAMIDPVDPPLGFGRIQAADIVGWNGEKAHPGYMSLRDAISGIVGPSEEENINTQNEKPPESNINQNHKESTGTIKPSNKKRLIFGISAAVLILIISVGVYISLNNGNNNGRIAVEKTDISKLDISRLDRAAITPVSIGWKKLAYVTSSNKPKPTSPLITRAQRTYSSDKFSTSEAPENSKSLMWKVLVDGKEDPNISFDVVKDTRNISEQKVFENIINGKKTGFVGSDSLYISSPKNASKEFNVIVYVK